MKGMMEYLRKTYGVPAKRGMFVQIHTGRGMVHEGRITSCSGNYFCMGGSLWHPTWNVVYYDDDGNVLLDTREAKDG